ncbi:HNH endonuclease signature motif containing protein [Microbispora amethystogenes]|uniref:HNH endonuclease signature motif containing protein n=2 Tax=Microbispora amethystogenes TaxID=1427754 RepID=UPI0031EB7206
MVALVPVPEDVGVCLAEAEELLAARDRITSALAARVGRVHQAGEAKNHGHASTKLWLRSAGGMTPAGAGRLLTMSMELARLPQVCERFAEGSLAEGVVEAICTATAGLTDEQAATAERILLELAASAGAAEVAKAGRYLRAVLDPDGHEKDEQADFDRRFFRVRRRRGGGLEGEFYLPVEVAARLQHMLDVYAKPKAEGDDRTLSVRNADPLIAFLENRIVTELLVLVNAESLPDDPPGANPCDDGKLAGTDTTDIDPTGTDLTADHPAADPGGEPRAGDAPGHDSGSCQSGPCVSGPCDSGMPECDGDRFVGDAPMQGEEHRADVPFGQDPATAACACRDDAPAMHSTDTPGGDRPRDRHAHGCPGGDRLGDRPGECRAPACPGGDRRGGGGSDGGCPVGGGAAGDYSYAFASGEAPSGMPGAGADARWGTDPDAPPGAEHGGDAWPGGEPGLGGEAWAGAGPDAPPWPGGEAGPESDAWAEGDAWPGVGADVPPGAWLRGLPGLILATGQLLPVSSVHRLARTSTLVRIVMNAAGQVLDMGRKVRLATPAQRRAVFARYATCWVDGCPLPATLCQIDHADDWSRGGLTDLKLLGPACQFHNRDRYRHPARYTRRKTGDDRWAFTYRNPYSTRRART